MTLSTLEKIYWHVSIYEAWEVINFNYAIPITALSCDNDDKCVYISQRQDLLSMICIS